MAASVRIWQKKQLRLDLLTVNQRAMVDIGAAGLLSVKKRLAQGQGADDGPAKPLKRRYALYKQHRGERPIRDLFFTGKMLANLQLRTVNDNHAVARCSSEKERIKALANQRRESWCVFSSVNRRDVIKKANEVIHRIIEKLVITK
jgi:hypothetical protein